jgi:hypothetical protein
MSSRDHFGYILDESMRLVDNANLKAMIMQNYKICCE